MKKFVDLDFFRLFSKTLKFATYPYFFLYFSYLIHFMFSLPPSPDCHTVRAKFAFVFRMRPLDHSNFSHVTHPKYFQISSFKTVSWAWVKHFCNFRPCQKRSCFTPVLTISPSTKDVRTERALSLSFKSFALNFFILTLTLSIENCLFINIIFYLNIYIIIYVV